MVGTLVPYIWGNSPVPYTHRRLFVAWHKIRAMGVKAPLLEVIHPAARLEGISPCGLALVELHITRGLSRFRA
jgi:hypothetical protein